MDYDTLGIQLSVHRSNFDLDKYDLSQLPKLPPEMEEEWYSKYYYMGRKESEAAKLIRPMDPACALMPGDVDRWTKPEIDDTELGYCILPNGCGYCAADTVLPSVSFEMFRWYRQLRTFDELAFMIWYPGSHISDKEGACVEDLGFGDCHCDVDHPVKIADFGFSAPPEELDPKFIGLVGGGGWAHNLKYPEVQPYYITTVHYVREYGDNGIEFRTRGYIGMRPEDGKAVVLQDNIEPNILMEMCRQLTGHYVYERETMEQFLPEVYEKMKDIDMSKASTNREAWSIEAR